MDFSNFLWMRDELSLLTIILVLFLYDTFGTEKSRRAFSWVACLLLAAQTAFLFFNPVTGEAFGGMYQTSPVINVVKIVLNIGTLLVLIQANAWAKSPDMAVRRGEFYVLTLMTLLGMYLMISSGNFLLFFIGLEMASLPLTALVAIEKYHQLSYEAAAKYVFVALFSSSLMLLGISFIYGAVGTLYFTDMAAQLLGTPLLYVGLVLFLAGMGFKISIVPFHLWTADVYQGAPTSITAYLSVISKGAAAFALMVVLFKVFSSVAVVWQPVLWGLIVITITIGNLFAVRQKNLKRFMAFSSISQAGYILLGVIAGSAVGMTSLIYYVLVYVFSNLAVFGVISVIENATGKIGMDGSLLSGRYSSFRRIFQQVLHLLCRRRRGLLCIGVHCLAQHHHLSLLLSVGGEGDVYPSGRLRDTHYPERRRLETQHFALRAWRAVGGIDQRYLFVDYPLIIRNVIL